MRAARARTATPTVAVAVAAAVALAALASAGCQTQACRRTCVATAAAPRPFLGEVSGPGGRLVLFGTYHAAGREDVPACRGDVLRLRRGRGDERREKQGDRQAPHV